MKLEFKTPYKRSINVVKNGFKMAEFSYGSTFYTKIKKYPRLYVFLCLLPVTYYVHSTIYEELIIGH